MGLAKKTENNRIYFVFFGMLAIGIAIFFKMSIIQFKEGEQWRSKADSLTIKDEIIPANRGNIYSADGSLLATSIPKYTIYFDPYSPSNENFEQNIRGFSDSLAKFIPKKIGRRIRSLFPQSTF